MVEIVLGEKSVDKQTRSPKRSNRRVNMNTADESVIRELPGVNFIEARRICVERPFEDEAELLKVRGVSRDILQHWKAGLILPCARLSTKKYNPSPACALRTMHFV